MLSDSRLGKNNGDVEVVAATSTDAREESKQCTYSD